MSLPPEPVFSYYGAIDVGTSNCRLLISRVSLEGDVEEMERYSQTVFLGKSLERTGVLSEEAIERTVRAVGQMVARMQEYPLRAYRCVTTEACRRARNTSVLLDKIAKETGVKLEVISPEEEAFLIMQACVPLLNPTLPYAICIDIGAGSTDIVFSRHQKEGFQLKHFISIPCGVMTLMELYAGIEDPLERYKAMVDAMSSRMQSYLEMVASYLPSDLSLLQAISTSGTLTTFVALELKLSRYDRTMVDCVTITRSAMQRWIISLRMLSHDALIRIPVIGPQRATLMVSGCAILDAILKAIPLQEIQVGDRGLREGIILHLHHQHSTA